MLNKIFTVPYLDKMATEDMIPDSFLKCVKRYVNNDKQTIGEALSEIYHYMDKEYRNEYFYKNTILNRSCCWENTISIIHLFCQNYQLRDPKQMLS